MRRSFSVPAIAATTGAVVFMVSGQTGAAMTELSSDGEREAYSLGVVVAAQALSGLGQVDNDAFVAGVADLIGEKDLALDDAQITESLARFEKRHAEEAQAVLAARIEANRNAGEAFRKSFAEDPKVETLNSGLQYKVLEAGEGEMPGSDETVTLHYRSTLIDGREIDSSYTRNEPVTVEVDKVIPGWTEALTHMAVGSKWQVVIPPELAYGDLGAGNFIEPGSTVIFEMELISKS